MAYIGAVDVSVSSTRTNQFWNKTITVSSKTLTGIDDRGSRLTIPQSYAKYAVYYNGLRLTHYSDYTHSTDDVLTFTETLNPGDVVYVEFFTANELHSSNEPLPLTGGTATGTIEAPEIVRTNKSQPEGYQLLSRVNAPYIGDNSIIRTNESLIKQNLEIPIGTNGMSAGPITIDKNVTITISGTWTVI